jgi:hypothetical protein
MPNPVEPIELCLESVDRLEDDQPYVRCVAISGAEPGLGLSAEGEITWCQTEAASATFWVSADNQLIVTRNRESDEVRLIRAERFLDLPLEKPVVVLNEDLVVINGHGFRVHVHGVAASVEPPTRLALRRVQSMIAGAAVAALSIAGCHTGTANTGLASSSASTTISTVASTGGTAASSALVATGGVAEAIGETNAQGGTTAQLGSTGRLLSTRVVKPIEIRHAPPKPALPLDKTR